MKDLIRLTLNYFRLKKYLMEDLDYTEHQAIRTISDIRKMDPSIRRAFILWFTKGEEPKDKLCGVNFQNLMNYRNLNPVAAFLAIDWYREDPMQAFSVLGTGTKDSGMELVQGMEKELDQILQRLDVKKEPETEDTRDIT